MQLLLDSRVHPYKDVEPLVPGSRACSVPRQPECDLSLFPGRENTISEAGALVCELVTSEAPASSRQPEPPRAEGTSDTNLYKGLGASVLQLPSPLLPSSQQRQDTLGRNRSLMNYTKTSPSFLLPSRAGGLSRRGARLCGRSS